MKIKSAKQSKQTKAAVQLKDLVAKKNPKGGAELLHEATHAQQSSTGTRVRSSGGGGCDDFGCGTNHNETLVSDSAR